MGVIGGIVGEERGAYGIEGRRSEEAFGLREKGKESEREGGEQIEEREAEELGMEDEGF